MIKQPTTNILVNKSLMIVIAILLFILINNARATFNNCDGKWNLMYYIKQCPFTFFFNRMFFTRKNESHFFISYWYWRHPSSPKLLASNRL